MEILCRLSTNHLAFTAPQTNPDPFDNPTLDEDVLVTPERLEQRRASLGPKGVFRKVYLFIHDPKDDAWLRRLATMENIQKEQSAKDQGQTLPDLLTAMRQQVQAVEPQLRDRLRLAKEAGSLKVLSDWDPEDDPLPFKTVQLYHDEEGLLWGAMTYEQRAAIKLPGNKRFNAEVSAADHLNVNLHTPDGVKAVQDNLMLTTLEHPPKRTIWNLLQYESSMVIIADNLRESMQVIQLHLYLVYSLFTKIALKVSKAMI